MRLLLVNPNTSSTTTEAMLAIARSAAPADVAILGATASSGASLITCPEGVAEAERVMLTLLRGGAPPGIDGIIIAAFADPALPALCARLRVPVTGIAEAGMAEAAEGERRFAVVTTTPGLAGSIKALAARYGHSERFLGVFLTEGDAAAVTNDPVRLPEALRQACERAITEANAEAIVIGGGPLAVAARAIAGDIAVALIEPVPASVRLAMRRAEPRVRAP